jgi:RimJ/RimL family protein N-acetyltransferase
MNEMNYRKYIFTSDRLGFRNWNISDLDEFARLNADEDVMEHFPSTMSMDEVSDLIYKLGDHYAENGFTYFATEILKTQEFIGMIGLAYQEYITDFTPAIDIGWRLKKSAWGNGFATEGAKRCIDFAFNELGIDKIISVCVFNNEKSENVMKKVGMTKIGEFYHPSLTEYPEYQRHHCYEIRRGKDENG